MSGRRRTDEAASPWAGMTGPRSPQPPAPPQGRPDRSPERRPAAVPDANDDTGRRRPEGAPGHTRPPLPPVRPVAAAPQTTMAPFTPSPHGRPRDEDLWTEATKAPDLR